MMNINDLPDVCFRITFSHLPAKDLLNLEDVCTKWATLARSVGCAQKRLTILVGEDPQRAHRVLTHANLKTRYGALISSVETSMPGYELNPAHTHLYYASLDSAIVLTLLRMFPRISHLEVVLITRKNQLKFKPELNLFVRLLEDWAPFLVSLKLAMILYSYPITDSNDYLRLYSSLNQMQNLRELTFISDLWRCFHEESERVALQQQAEAIQLPVLAQLDRLNLECDLNEDKVILKSLINFIHPESAKPILAIGQTMEEPMKELEFFQSQENLHLFRRIVHLPHITYPQENLSALSRFDSLQSISFELDFLQQVPKIMRSLTQLKHLIHLELSFCLFADEVMEAEVQGQESPLPVHPGIKLLTLFGDMNNHDQLYDLEWARMLPNLQMLYFHCLYCFHNGPICDLCYFQTKKPERYAAPSNEKVRECLRRVLRPFAQCPHLGKVYFDRGNPERSFELSGNELK